MPRRNWDSSGSYWSPPRALNTSLLDRLCSYFRCCFPSRTRYQDYDSVGSVRSPCSESELDRAAQTDDSIVARQGSSPQKLPPDPNAARPPRHPSPPIRWSPPTSSGGSRIGSGYFDQSELSLSIPRSNRTRSSSRNPLSTNSTSWIAEVSSPSGDASSTRPNSAVASEFSRAATLLLGRFRNNQGQSQQPRSHPHQ